MSINKNVFQQVFEISEVANMLCDHSGTHPENKRLVNKSLENINPKCDLAWGPSAWEKTPSDSSPESAGRDAVFIVSGSSMPFDDGITYTTYVIAVGATGGTSDPIRSIEDIGSVIDIDLWASSGVSGLETAPPSIPNKDLGDSSYIANGFGRAVFNLINSKAPVPSTSETLLQSVQRAAADPNAKIVFTGHSVGGAVVALLAYVLAKVGVFGSAPFSRIHVYPTGAPSPGNSKFIQNFSNYFPPSAEQPKGYRNWNLNIVNQFDVVPHAYASLDDIPSMYNPPNDGGSKLEAVNETISTLKEQANGLYRPFKSSTFESPVPKPPIAPGSEVGFLLCAAQQHISAYQAYVLGPNAD